MRYADSRCKVTETFENGHFYHFTGPCHVTGKEVTVAVPGPELFAYRQGKLMQDAMPSVSQDDREFLMSGTSKEGWEELFGPPEMEGDEETEFDIDWETEMDGDPPLPKEGEIE